MTFDQSIKLFKRMCVECFDFLRDDCGFVKSEFKVVSYEWGIDYIKEGVTVSVGQEYGLCPSVSIIKKNKTFYLGSDRLKKNPDLKKKLSCPFPVKKEEVEEAFRIYSEFLREEFLGK